MVQKENCDFSARSTPWENPLIAILLQVQLQAFKLNAPTIRDVTKRELAKIGLAGLRTNRREFGTNDLNRVIPIGELVFKNFHRVAILGHVPPKTTCNLVSNKQNCHFAQNGV